MTQPQGEVFDIGYQRYEGPREGRGRARLALWKNGVRTALGLGRSVVSKILPSLLIIFMLVPALVEMVEPPFEFSDIHAADCTDWDGSSSHPAFLELTQAISEFLPADSIRQTFHIDRCQKFLQG